MRSVTSCASNVLEFKIEPTQPVDSIQALLRNHDYLPSGDRLFVTSGTREVEKLKIHFLYREVMGKFLDGDQSVHNSRYPDSLLTRILGGSHEAQETQNLSVSVLHTTDLAGSINSLVCAVRLNNL